jgi:hypothetical protein
MLARWLLGLTSALLGLSGPWVGPAPARGEAPRTAVEISFVLRAPSGLPVQGLLLLRPPEEKGEPLRQVVASPAPLSLSLPAGSRWEVSADLPGFWVQRKTLTVGSPDQRSRLALDLWPLGTISGVV